MSYFCELSSRQKRLNFTTDPNWSKIYVNEGLINDCPLMGVGWHFKTIILDWNTVKPTNKLQRDVIGIRDDFGYSNGISFSNEIFGIRESLALAAEYAHKDFYNAILENLNEIFVNITKIGKITEKAMKQLKWVNNTKIFYTPLEIMALKYYNFKY